MDVTLPSSTADALLGSRGSSIGTCFGYGIDSTLPFTFLRNGSGSLLTVARSDEPWRPTDDPVMEWPRRSDRPLHARIYADGARFRMWTDLEGWFTIDPTEPSVTAPTCDDPIRLEHRILGIPLLLCFLRRGDLPLHAAVVEVEGGALLLAAPGHFGKTTLACAFLMAGHRVLSEDIACCRLSGTPAVYPGPAMLRVRRATYERLTFPRTRIVAEAPDRVHLALEGDARGDGDPVPLRGVIFLQGGDGAGDLRRVEPAAAVPNLWALSLKLPSDEDRSRCFQASAELADRIPTWELRRELSFDTLPGLVDKISATCLGTT